MVNAIACTIELWCTREVAKHERSVRVARGVGVHTTLLASMCHAIARNDFFSSRSEEKHFL